jgi:hypothetical protein
MGLRRAGPLNGPRQDTINLRRSGNVVGPCNLQITPANQSVSAGVPVIITAKFVNVSGASQVIQVLPPSKSIYTIVRHSDGRIAPLTSVGKDAYSMHYDERPFIQRLLAPGYFWDNVKVQAGTMWDFPLPSGSSQNFDVAVSNVYEMSQPDIYTVESEAWIVGTKDLMVGNVVTIEVK